MATTNPNFITFYNQEGDTRIRRVSETPESFVSLYDVEYTDEQGEDADWTQYGEQWYLNADSTDQALYLGSGNADTRTFEDGPRFRLTSDQATEYTRDEMLELVKSWDAEFSGYTYWDGHNWQLLETDNAAGTVEAADLRDMTEVASSKYWGRTHTLYASRLNGDFTLLVGLSGAGGETLEDVGSEDNAARCLGDYASPMADAFREGLKNAAMARIENLLAERQMTEEDADKPYHSYDLLRAIAALNELGDESTEQELRECLEHHQTLS